MVSTAKKILVVEDDPIMLKVLSENLTREGFRVVEARDGVEGLSFAEKEKPDLILTDIIMPMMDGITMLKKLRNEKWGENVPVIILTNLSDSTYLAEAVERGVYDFLVKTDWKLKDVIKKIKKRIGKKD